MIRIYKLVNFLCRISFKMLLILSIVMLLHIGVITLGTSLKWWHITSHPLDIALLTFLYYVVPLIVLFSIYLITKQFSAHLEAAYIVKKQRKTIKSARTVPTHPMLVKNRPSKLTKTKKSNDCNKK